MRIKGSLKLMINQRFWRKENKHNHTRMGNNFPRNVVEIGRGTYGTITVSTSAQSKCIEIGSWCSIAEGVLFITGNEHHLNRISTYPFCSMFGLPGTDACSRGRCGIRIDDDVWLGARSIILDGVHIGQGAVVGAGSVVSHDVEPYTIVAGNPARVIRKRFPEDILKRLLGTNLCEITQKMVKRKPSLWTEDLTMESLDQMENLLCGKRETVGR
ncbi:CatB-related O-acetyltransferase [Collinsella tanakaei]|uniref:CatB-related O-acetyltransferase n=1 Tax=Collinsella tanakaei TaxID=626935 RepID=UPI0025A40BE3|nr:CatB-related O-acetyltransferase [Collinsella tanakaei]